jgi:hypothetical protein
MLTVEYQVIVVRRRVVCDVGEPIASEDLDCVMVHSEPDDSRVPYDAAHHAAADAVRGL